MSSLYQMLRQTEARAPCSTAVVLDGISISYRELIRNVQDVIHFLDREGVKPKQRLLIIEGSAYSLIKLEIAASYLGLTLVYLDGLTRATPSEIDGITADAHADWFVGSRKTVIGMQDCMLSYDGNVELMQDRPLPKEAHLPESIFIQCYTSGTTGTPKGVCLSERGLLIQSNQVAKAMRLHSAARVLLEANITDMVGQLLMLASFCAGSALIIDTSAKMKTMSLVELHHVTHLMLPPYYLREVLQELQAAPRDLASIELIAYGCAPIDDHLLKQARSSLTCLWLQGYGLTETAGPFCWLAPEQQDEGKGSVGQPAPGVRLEVRDSSCNPLPTGTIGEIWVASPSNMYGYWDSATASPQSAGKIKAGWLKTGDAGFLNTEGFLTLKGRLDDVVLLSEGFTVYPKELENVLSTVPGIIELAVVSANDPAGNGQVPIVFFRTKYDLADSITELRTRIKETLSPIKHPKYLVFTQQTFSRGTNGKVIKQKLIDKLDEVQLIPFSPPLL